jgi:GTP-binding protein Era
VSTHRAGYVAIVGRPNVGKSTLLNALIGQKVAIVTPKPQTTRDTILGIKNVPGAQIIFVDTPGLHPARGVPLNDRMRGEALRAIGDADVVLLLTEAATAPGKPLPNDDRIALEAIAEVRKPVVLVMTKSDRARNKEALLPQIERMTHVRPFDAVVPTSAVKKVGLDALVREIVERLPESPPFFPEEMVTDRAERFLAAELVREQITLLTHDELPYSVAVVVERWEDDVLLPSPAPRSGKGGKPGKPGKAPRAGPRELSRIWATIHVNRQSQKAIVVGKGGTKLRAIGTAARHQIEAMVGHQVHLELFVRVSAGWAESARGVDKLTGGS